MKKRVHNFHEVSRLLELKTIYGECVEDMCLPSDKRDLSIKSAQWFLDVSEEFGTPDMDIVAAELACEEFLKIANV